MSRNSSSQWGTTTPPPGASSTPSRGADYSLIFNKDGYQIAKRNG